MLCLLLIWAAPIPPIRPPKLPPPPSVQVGDAHVVQSVDMRVCVHTRLTDEVEEWKIQKTLQLVREMGASTVVEFFPWAYIENTQGDYNWHHVDRTLLHAENQGVRVIARLGLVPAWAQGRSEFATLNYLPDESFEDFARFAGAFAARYKGRIDHIIIWNEPNLNFEWGERPPDPIAYTRLLGLAYRAAHIANPDVVILGGALASTLAPPGGVHGGWDDLDYLQRMYEAGAGAYFDALAVHNYPFTAPPQADPAPSLLNFRRLELIRQIMEANGDEAKPIYITETGWNDHPRFAYAVRPAQRIQYTLAMYEYSRRYPWLETICIWQFRLPAPTNSYPDYFTLVSTNFDLKPIYEALQAYARGW